jgi:hypothetical protein
VIAREGVMPMVRTRYGRGLAEPGAWANGATQEALAGRLGVARKTVARWEGAERGIPKAVVGFVELVAK